MYAIAYIGLYSGTRMNENERIRIAKIMISAKVYRPIFYRQ